MCPCRSIRQPSSLEMRWAYGARCLSRQTLRSPDQSAHITDRSIHRTMSYWSLSSLAERRLEHTCCVHLYGAVSSSVKGIQPLSHISRIASCRQAMSCKARPSGSPSRLLDPSPSRLVVAAAHDNRKGSPSLLAARMRSCFCSLPLLAPHLHYQPSRGLCLSRPSPARHRGTEKARKSEESRQLANGLRY